MRRIELVRERILRDNALVVAAVSAAMGIPGEQLLDEQAWRSKLRPEHMDIYYDGVDHFACAFIVRSAQTFVFDSPQILDFAKSLNLKLPPGDYHVPFQEMIFQFTDPIPEEQLFLPEQLNGFTLEDDKVLALVVGVPTEPQPDDVANIIAFFTSGAINRVTLSMAGDGTVDYRPTWVNDPAQKDVKAANKQRLATLGMLVLAYLNSPVVEVKHVASDPQLTSVNAKRARKGKKTLPNADYYITYIRKERAPGDEDAPVGRGRHISYLFPVRGHFRHLPNARLTWVRAHFRGLEHDQDPERQRIYRVTRSGSE